MLNTMPLKDAKLAVMLAGGEHGIQVTLGNRVHGEMPDGSVMRLRDRESCCGYELETEDLLQSVQAVIRNNRYVSEEYAFSDSFRENHDAFAKALMALV